MAKVRALWIAIAAPFAVEALNIFQPRATGLFVYPENGFTPRPTDGPRLYHELVRKDSSHGPLTVLAAPDNTCGYVDGLQGAAYTCTSTDYCVFYSAEGSHTGSVGCCNTEACYVRRTCIDYDSFFSSSACLGGCEYDAFALKCTATSAPYCNTVSIGSRILDYWCNDLNNSTPQTISTTYKGQSGSRSFSPVVVTSSSLSEISSVPSDMAAPIVPASNSSNASPASTSGNDSNSNKKSGSSTPAGPIAGGVVGGIAALGFIGLGIFFILRRHGKSQELQTAKTSPMQLHSVPPSAHDSNKQFFHGGGLAGQLSPSTPQQLHGQPPVAGSYPYANQQTPFDPYAPSVSSPSSTVNDPRMWNTAISPVAGYQPQQEAIYEAPTQQPSKANRGEMHELSS